MSSVAGVVLAAGASRRLGTAKQMLLDERGQTLVVRAASQLLEAGCGAVLVVTGSSHEDVEAAVSGLPVDVTFNADWEEGIASSIRAAISWLESEDVFQAIDAILFTVCDVPSLSAKHLRGIIAASSNHSQTVASEYNSQAGPRVHGIPALFPRTEWGALSALRGDRGARELLLRPGIPTVYLSEGGQDIDSPQDLLRWRGSPSS